MKGEPTLATLTVPDFPPDMTAMVVILPKDPTEGTLICPTLHSQQRPTPMHYLLAASVLMASFRKHTELPREAAIEALSELMECTMLTDEGEGPPL